ncbi:MAG: phosphoenolpyruvate carboxykinase (ATP), partial [Fimbriimonadales bacterium]
PGTTTPQMTFSACFGAPFLPMHPSRYAEMLGEQLARHSAQVWLVNTGWTGGAYGVGTRIPIRYTRAMIRSALRFQLEDVPYRTDPIFGLEVPTQVDSVPSELFDPRQTWQDKSAYDRQAHQLAEEWQKHLSAIRGTKQG